MGNHLYRFRPTKYLLEEEYQELENQEIYFSSQDEWNDPLEGYKNIAWKGDIIVWQNLFKHYLLNLLWLTVSWVAKEKIGSIDEEFKSLRNSSDFPTESGRKSYIEASEIFLKYPEINSYLNFLASRTMPIHRAELLHHLSRILLPALAAISFVFEKIGVPAIYRRHGRFLTDPFLSNEFLNGLKNIEISQNSSLFEAFENSASGFSLARHYEIYKESPNQSLSFLFLDYPNHYIKKIEALIHPRWYAACFTTAVQNASLWGYYAASHTGVALKYKATAGKGGAPSITLFGINGMGGTRDNIKLSQGNSVRVFQKTTYSTRYPEIDFFRSLNLSAPELNRDWYRDADNNVSVCAGHLENDENFRPWHEKYWRNFDDSATTKHSDWSHEEEYRLVLSELAISYQDKARRKFRYEFSDLEGIVFGIKTPLSEKLRIIRIIEGKCKKEGRIDFNFYQASYSNNTGLIEISKLNPLDFP